jgi:CAAX prenyl protease-like protein
MGKKSVAYTAPFFAFMLFIALAQGLDAAHLAPWGLGAIYVVYPVQTVACAAVLAWFWRDYELRAPAKPWLAVGVGVLVFVLWVAPGVVFHRRARLEGFDPELFDGRAGVYWLEVVLRLARSIVVVPLLEEIFWRGCLLRCFSDEPFEAVPFGTYTWQANAVVAAGFMLEHSMPDWPAALAAGLLYNMVAFRTRSLSSCVLAHAITNALLSAYILATHQWGYW